MSLVATQEGTHIHFPANPDKFVFDDEVSRIFPEMARRSIPNFYEAHAMHARMLDPWVSNRQGLDVMDYGASRGAFAEAIHAFYGPLMDVHKVQLHMTDISDAMLDYMRRDFPTAKVTSIDLTSEEFLSDHNRPSYDVVALNYVLQFIDPSLQETVLDKILDSVKPGGVFIYGAKEADDTMLGELLHEQYIRFRMQNGYTRAEIEAKTAALKNSMWPTCRLWFLIKMAKAGFSVRETTRHSVFGTYFCIRDGGANNVAR